MPMFIDPRIVVDALSGLVPDIVVDVVEFTAVLRAGPTQGLLRWPRISVIAESTRAIAPSGLSDPGSVEETVLAMIQVKMPNSSASESLAEKSVRTIRNAVYDALHGVRISDDWREPRYAGGRLLGIDAEQVYTWGDRYTLHCI